MTFPTGVQVSTANLSSGAGNPASARVDLLTAVQNLNSITESPNTANNVVVLDTNGLIPNTSIPATINNQGNLTLNPSTGIVKIQNYLRLQIVPKATVLANTDQAFGDMVLYADDLTGANAGLAIWNGTNWKVIATLGSLANLS